MISSQANLPHHNLSQMDFSSLPGNIDKDASPDSISSGDSKKKIPRELTAHGTTPSGKPRLFVCNTCTRAFARLEHLRRHERSHTKEKPFTCGVCQRKFSRRDLLLRHAQKLHAGCADAITRLRRKLMKLSSISSASGDVYEDSMVSLQSPYQTDYTTPGLAPHKLAASAKAAALTEATASAAIPTPNNSHRGSLDSIQFNLNLFNPVLGPRKPKKDMKTPALSRNPSIKDPNLQRQMFDRRKTSRNRGASFSAQSGGNYAMAMPEYDSYPGADNVEFSTPQLLPSTLGDDSSWFSNLLTIPGMENPHKAHPTRLTRDESITSLSLEGHDLQNPTFQNMMRSDSLTSGGSFHNLDAPTPGQPPFPSQNGSFSKASRNEPSVNTGARQNELGDVGYSFYGIPESMMGKSTGMPKMHQPLSPIKQELDDELMDLDNGNHFDNSMHSMNIPAAITNGVNFDINFLKDIDELTQDFDVGLKFLPNGYSFYGDIQSVSSSGIDSTLPPQLLSPSGTSNNHLYSQYAQAGEQHSGHTENGYSRTTLFTKNIRYMINKSLSKYPISGIMSPSIPSNEKLEQYLQNFVSMFLSHFPFIHPSKLNEYEIMNMTSNESMSNESARVCMPLLVATIGALLANNKNDSEHLYEASRRTIHIYLENRKNATSDMTGSSQNPSQTVNPLWLIQSLTLSVIYGLFSDNDNNVYIVIRQLNALNSLVKTSIKSNRKILFSISGEDEEYFRIIHENGTSNKDLSMLSNDEEKGEVLFKNNISLQSQARIVFMIYKLTNFILMTYNVPLTLSINDLGNLMCPNTYDEYLWSFKSFEEFTNYQRATDTPHTVEFYLSKNEHNSIVFKDLLFKLLKNDMNPSLVSQLSNLSKYGFTSVAHGIYEMKQYDEMKYIDVYSILDNLTMFIDNAKNNADTRIVKEASMDFEKQDYALLVDFIKISATVDFKLVKEQSWLKNYDELTKNYHKFLTSIDSSSDGDLLRVIDCCIHIVKLILFKTEDRAGDSQNPLSSDFSFGNNSLLHQYDTCSNFEKILGWKVLDEIDITKNSVHSQILFHVFTILSIFAIFIAKRNHVLNEYARNEKSNATNQLNQRFMVVLRILARIEQFLKTKYRNSKHESDLTNLYLFSSFNNDSLLMDSLDFMHSDEAMKQLADSHENYFAYSLEKSLYVLKIGELMLRYLYDTNIKVCIFRKLSGSLLQMRKFLIDNESRILT